MTHNSFLIDVHCVMVLEKEWIKLIEVGNEGKERSLLKFEIGGMVRVNGKR